MSVVLSIGTVHPWNIAGSGLDLRIGEQLGSRVLTVVAAVSAQDASGVHALHAVPAAIVEAQLAAIPWSDVDAIRVGALGSREAVNLVAGACSRAAVPAVVDPVISASRGGTLSDEATVEAMRAFLAMPNAIVTPNLDEAQVFLGAPVDREQIAGAAQRLRAGCRAVLLKGGHLTGDPVDALATGDRVTLFTEPRVAGTMRGTGCVLAMALACALARGDDLHDAVRFARFFVRGQIASARQFGGLPVAY
jgi:hydroxymethylpyrimidine/phosphomethylpyrimidine kinase